MVHTLPDYTTKYKLSQFFATIDQAELAARLGSIITRDRRGRVIWFDDFNDTISKWGVAATGEGGGVSADTANPYFTKSCAKLETGTGAGSYCSLNKYFFLPVDTRLGFEWIFSMKGPVKRIENTNYIYKGTKRYPYTLYLDTVNNVIKLSTAAGYVTIEDGDYTFLLNEYYYCHCKLVIDPVTNKYVRLIIADKEIDVSDYEPSSNAYSSERAIYENFIVGTNSTANAIAYVNGFIFTQDEP